MSYLLFLKFIKFCFSSYIRSNLIKSLRCILLWLFIVVKEMKKNGQSVPLIDNYLKRVFFFAWTFPGSVPFAPPFARVISEKNQFPWIQWHLSLSVIFPWPLWCVVTSALTARCLIAWPIRYRPWNDLLSFACVWI